MHSRALRSVLLAGACLAMACGGGRPAWADAATEGSAPAAQSGWACDAAGAAAERRYDVPSGLLRAIGRSESGRRDPGSGAVAPWSWTINAEGRGQLFETQAEALAATRKLQAMGVASIDVGCFQVNLVHHAAAFATLEEGFDPQRNADYAGRFLQSLRTRTGSWEAAVGAYHSATPERGEPYRDRVLASWLREGGSSAALVMPRVGAPPGGALPGGAPPGGAPLAAPVMRTVVWSPLAVPAGQGKGAAGGMRIWTPSAAGQGASMIRITRG